MTDTTPAAAAAVRAAILRTSPVDRMRSALVLSDQMRELSLAALRARHPELSTLQLVERLLGEQLIPAASIDREAAR